MAKKGIRTEASPMSWDQFLTLISRIALDIDNSITNETKKKQLVKFLLLIAVGCYTGLRIGDILLLRWNQLLKKDSQEIIEQKTNKLRLITINQNLTKLLEKYVDYIKPPTYNDLIFTNQSGEKSLSIQYVNRQLKELFKKYKVKVKNPSSHSLRKSFGLRVFEMNYKNDEALIILSQVFNHSNTSITRRYLGLQDKKIENVYLNL